MRLTVVLVLAVVALAVFAGLVYAVLIVAHVAQPAAVTVQGLTGRRLWATISAVLALTGLIIGGVTLSRPGSVTSRRPGAIVAVVVGLVAAGSGGLNLVMANGGPGTGNGVVGGAAAFVLGLIAIALGALALGRSRRVA